jgi:hypothetical protein
VTDLLINLLASVIAGTAVWAAQRALRYRRLAIKRAFFGLADGADCLLAVSKHASSQHDLSVHRRDVAALVELATIAKDCGGRADLVSTENLPQQIGRLTEFCVGGPHGNPRMAAHLRTLLRGVTFVPFEEAAKGPLGRLLTFRVAGMTFTRDPDKAEYVTLARTRGPAGGKPVFLLLGQTAETNVAAARYLAANYRRLYRQFGADRPFCLVLRVVEPPTYGTDFTELVADVTDRAFEPPAPAAQAIPQQSSVE